MNHKQNSLKNKKNFLLYIIEKKKKTHRLHQVLKTGSSGIVFLKAQDFKSVSKN